MPMFKDLNEKETREYTQWAVDNHQPGDPINPMWHPVVRTECREINRRHHESKVPDATIDQALEAIQEALQDIATEYDEELMGAITDLAHGHYKAAIDAAEAIINDMGGDY